MRIWLGIEIEDFLTLNWDDEWDDVGDLDTTHRLYYSSMQEYKVLFDSVAILLFG